MFYNCFSLLLLNVNGFETSRVVYMDFMFYNCSSLKSLNLNHFSISSIKSANYMFYNCTNLEYLNIYFFKEKSGASFSNMFTYTSDYLIYCIRENIKDTDEIKSQLVSKNCSINDCSYNWKSRKIKTIVDTNICTDSCSKFSLYEYDFICYHQCPIGTFQSKNKEYLCKNISDYTYDFKEAKNQINDVMNNIKNGEMDSEISDIINGNKDEYILKEENVVVQIGRLN